MVKDANQLRSNPIGAASSNGAGIRAAPRGSVGFIGLGRMGTVMAETSSPPGIRSSRIYAVLIGLRN